MRSSQPLTGPNNKRCKEDERIVNSMLVNGKRGYIIDTRSQTSAQAAKVRLEELLDYHNFNYANDKVDLFGLSSYP